MQMYYQNKRTIWAEIKSKVLQQAINYNTTHYENAIATNF